jgi:hypothetical protein
MAWMGCEKMSQTAEEIEAEMEAAFVEAFGDPSAVEQQGLRAAPPVIILEQGEWNTSTIVSRRNTADTIVSSPPGPTVVHHS